MKKNKENVLETILLTFDYVGSTKISKNLTFEQTVDFYQIPLNIFTRVIIEHYGIPWKYIGDQIIVLYNIKKGFLPVADISFKCAERLIKVSNEIVAPKLERGEIEGFCIRVSLDAGKLVPIAIKKGEKIIPDVAGVTINRLAKISSVTEPNQILVGDNYFRLLHNSIQRRFKKSDIKAPNFQDYQLWELFVE